MFLSIIIPSSHQSSQLGVHPISILSPLPHSDLNKWSMSINNTQEQIPPIAPFVINYYHHRCPSPAMEPFLSDSNSSLSHFLELLTKHTSALTGSFCSHSGSIGYKMITSYTFSGSSSREEISIRSKQYIQESLGMVSNGWF